MLLNGYVVVGREDAFGKRAAKGRCRACLGLGLKARASAAGASFVFTIQPLDAYSPFVWPPVDLSFRFATVSS